MGGYLRKFIKIFLTLGLVFAFFFFLGYGALALVRNMGRSSILDAGASDRPMLSSKEDLPDEFRQSLKWQDDYIIYHRGVYDYNDDVMTFLIMGIDKADEEVKEVVGEINGGQADALFLLVLNPHDKSVKIVAINRNTMTDVDIYDKNGNYRSTVTAQISVQHGFGDGVKGSCELQKKAVSKLFYSLPIHGYAAINMSAVAAINDAVGGVDVTPAASFTAGDYSFREKEKVHLDGDMAFAYIHDRDITRAGSADLRLARQKEYLLALVKKVRDMVKENPVLVTTIYSAVEKQMTTDLTAKEVLYLATSASGYNFDRDSLYVPEGINKVGNDFEEFYVDDDALIELMLDVFYEKVGEY